MPAIPTFHPAISLTEPIERSQNYLLSQQYTEGYWWAELESNVTMTAEVVMLHKIWGTDKARPMDKAEAYLRSQQRDRGGWELYYGDGGHLSTSIEAYMALRLLGVPSSDPALQRAKTFILEKGGISKSRIFTKIHLALVGCYDWSGVPSIPSWIMLLPDNFWFNIYELSSWARSSTVPLIIVCDRRPVYQFDSDFNLNELYSEGIENVRYQLPENNDWTDSFIWLDSGFKLAEQLNLVPFRDDGIRAAEQWILQRQEPSGDWGGIIPAMLNSLLALHCLNYDINDPFVERGMAAVDRFSTETENFYYTQACISPVWDTIWVLRALAESGLPANHPALVKGGEWLLDKQVMAYGDWAVKNRTGKPGGWSFEFDNQYYPDVDDAAAAVMALIELELPDEDRKWGAIAKCLDWIMTMQCRPGGWAAFDIDNDQEWLNDLPYSDLKASIDPNTADVTARVLEMAGELHNHSRKAHLNLERFSHQLDRGLAYLDAEQEPEGCWFGRWGVNYIYGTSGVLSALSVLDPKTRKTQIERGANWLRSCQNADGGWGESCHSYRDRKFMGVGTSTPSQTAWAIMGLLDAGKATGNFAWESLEWGINYLISQQDEAGKWHEDEFTGTGFPCHFYIKYHFYAQYFPLLALSRYDKLVELRK
ncbi:squalene--hopene cyclase [Roseofilum casamattae]|uniref:Squalene--hopene cyclase n=1 Tax=Roseofilum casamattae BLCC-M143 TaxID=3022442 RepID=A0ABT7C0E6_9CYAN|nr:squalene--hopene cyclase [Roseofilum casamattae]MDJ1184917.1 squalene--hopene cyclase [Roseofilum casamattae BLCC-M143]